MSDCIILCIYSFLVEISIVALYMINVMFPSIDQYRSIIYNRYINVCIA